MRRREALLGGVAGLLGCLTPTALLSKQPDYEVTVEGGAIELVFREEPEEGTWVWIMSDNTWGIEWPNGTTTEGSGDTHQTPIFPP